MEIKLIELYCLICRLYDSNKVLKHQRLSNFKPRFTDRELVTCYFFAMLNNQNTKQEIYDYTARHWGAWFPDLPSYQAFSYRLNNLAADFALIFNHLLAAKLATAQAWSEDSIIDSFPVIIKRGKLSKTCAIAADVAAFGYCSSKDLYYYGVKLHSLAVRRLKSLPLPSSVFLSSAAKHDLTAFKEANPQVLTKNLFADKAYKDSQLKADLMSRGVALLTPCKRRRNDPAQSSMNRCGRDLFRLSDNRSKVFFIGSMTKPIIKTHQEFVQAKACSFIVTANSLLPVCFFVSTLDSHS